MKWHPCKFCDSYKPIFKCYQVSAKHSVCLTDLNARQNMYMSRKYRNMYSTRSLWYPVGKGFIVIVCLSMIYVTTCLSSTCWAYCWKNKPALRHLKLLVQPTLQPPEIIFKALSGATSRSVPIRWSMPLLSYHPQSVGFNLQFPNHCWIVWYVLNEWDLAESDVGGRVSSLKPLDVKDFLETSFIYR